MNGDMLVGLTNIGQIKAIQELIATGKVDVNYKDENGNSAINIAARHNDFDIVQLLVENGANVNTQDGWGRTPILWAEKHKNAEMIEYCHNHKNDA